MCDGAWMATRRRRDARIPRVWPSAYIAGGRGAKRRRRGGGRGGEQGIDKTEG